MALNVSNLLLVMLKAFLNVADIFFVVGSRNESINHHLWVSFPKMIIFSVEQKDKVFKLWPILFSLVHVELISVSSEGLLMTYYGWLIAQAINKRAASKADNDIWKRCKSNGSFYLSLIIKRWIPRNGEHRRSQHYKPSSYRWHRWSRRWTRHLHKTSSRYSIEIDAE